MKPCPVAECGRPIKADNPSKGDRIYEETYCSHYCRIFDEQGLERIPRLNKYHSGRFRWPEIHIPCEMCAEPTLIIHDIEKSNRQFCSNTCYHKLKSGKKRSMELGHLLLSILKHRATYSPKNPWMTGKSIAEYMVAIERFRINSYRVSSVMKRWVASGIVEHDDTQYRFDLKKLGETPLAQFMYDWVTMPYSQRVLNP